MTPWVAQCQHHTHNTAQLPPNPLPGAWAWEPAQVSTAPPVTVQGERGSGTPTGGPGGGAHGVVVHVPGRGVSHSCAGSSSGRSSGSAWQSSGTSRKPGMGVTKTGVKAGFSGVCAATCLLVSAWAAVDGTRVPACMSMRTDGWMLIATRTPAQGREAPTLTSSSSLVKHGPSSLFRAMITATTSLPFMTGVARMFLVT